MNHHEKLNYVEFPANNISETKRFFESAFDWTFVDYGNDYAAFSNEGLDGGFYRANACSNTQNGGALLVFYSNNLEATQAKIKAAGGRIIKDIFDFPGGRRFQFTEPSGNEFAAWSDT
ncbi:MAG: VOC family protein [Methylophilaceae bacterium]